MSYQIEDRIRTQTKSLIVNTNGGIGLGLNSKTNTFTAEDYIYRARLAEKALRYEDMLIQMRNVLDLKKKLTADERNLLVVAYKNAVTTRRTGVCLM
jgi:ribosomal protein S2